MSPHLDKLLCERYPTLFCDRNGDPAKTCMAWGFDCADGWFPLIDMLCRRIVAIAEREQLNVVATQVKEKFGTLRFYVRGANDQIYNLIDEYDYLSGAVCEKCGSMVDARTVNDGGWLRTLCGAHQPVKPEACEGP